MQKSPWMISDTTPSPRLGRTQSRPYLVPLAPLLALLPLAGACSAPAGRRRALLRLAAGSDLLAPPRSAAAAFLPPHLSPRFPAAVAEPASSRSRFEFSVKGTAGASLGAKMVMDLRAELCSCRSPLPPPCILFPSIPPYCRGAAVFLPVSTPQPLSRLAYRLITDYLSR
jgi:hypothetical protein